MDGTILNKKLKIEEKLAQLNEIAQKVDDIPTFTSDDRAFLEGLPGFPTVDGKKVLTATTESGETSLTYEEQESGALDYSTSEQATGQKWIDGKDIYFKTLNCGNLPNNSSISVPSGLTDATVIKMEAYAVGGSTIPLPYLSTETNNKIELSFENDNTVFIRDNADYSTLVAYVILYYTKAEVTKKRTSKK